ncbi:hypothetical protein FWC31_01805 [Candidatus Saccharibacteria bacterium]|nr:hypothetical protein [Candidatus Saccharibacteria bacterium]
MKKVEYGFSKGGVAKEGVIRFQVTEFDDVGWSETDEEQSINVINAPEVDAKRLAAMREEPHYSKIARLGEDAIEYALLNHEASEGNGVILYNMGAGGNKDHPVGAREAEVLAFANPDKQILLINNTGSGQSSLVPRDIMKQMKTDGIYGPQGEWMLRILEKQLEPYGDKIEIWGNSAGARVAMGMAAAVAAVGQNIANLRVVGPLSATDMTPLGFYAQLALMGKAAGNYGKSSPYNETLELCYTEKSGKKKRIKPNWTTQKGAFVDNMWNYQMAMRHASGMEADLNGAMTSVQEDITIIQPEFSKFATPSQMYSRLLRIAIDQEHVFRLHPELRHIIIKNHTDAISSEGAGARPQVTLYEIAKQR